MGLSTAGDTAQCVAKDSVFRFQNVKDLLFQHFSPISSASKSPELARPKLCKLYKNYRTHQGILSLASRVMGLLCRCKDYEKSAVNGGLKLILIF